MERWPSIMEASSLGETLSQAAPGVAGFCRRPPRGPTIDPRTSVVRCAFQMDLGGNMSAPMNGRRKRWVFNSAKGHLCFQEAHVGNYTTPSPSPREKIEQSNEPNQNIAKKPWRPRGAMETWAANPDRGTTFCVWSPIWFSWDCIQQQQHKASPRKQS